MDRIINKPQRLMVAFFRRLMGKAITFKYQCPNIMAKKTAAVIEEPKRTMNQTPLRNSSCTISVTMPIIVSTPNKEMAVITILFMSVEFQYKAVTIIKAPNQIHT